METMTVLGSDLMGFGISPEDAKALGKKLADQSRAPSTFNGYVLATALKEYDAATRQEIITQYQIAGGDGSILSDALRVLKMEASGGWLTTRNVGIWSALSAVSGAACAYHGYKRNNSVGWAIGWFLLGSIFFPLTPVIAVAQGFGKPREK